MVEKPNKSLDIVVKKHAPKAIQSNYYHGREDDAKFEAVVVTLDLQIFSLLCKASCRTFYI
jgi:hypothetical protein